MLTVGWLVAMAVLLWPGRHAHPASGPRRGRAVGGAAPSAPARPLRPGSRSAARLCQELADFAGLLSGPLRAGVPPGVAVEAARLAVAPTGPLALTVRDLLAAASVAESLSEVWLRHGAELDVAELRFVGQAWALTERTGAPLADALACAETVLRDRERTRQRLAAAAAGPRASMVVLCVLPATGPLAGLAMGIGPRRLYLASPLASGSVVIGLGLATGAYLWSRRIMERALRPALGPPRSG